MTETIDQCGLAKNVCVQLERELQMLSRNTDLGPEFMDGMRKRLSNLFTKLAAKLNSDNLTNNSQQNSALAKFQIEKPVMKPYE